MTTENLIDVKNWTEEDFNRIATGKTASRKKAHNKHHKEFEEQVGRNDPCPCGSGRRYKKCCM